MKLIVGLGNPGAKFKNTRHNIGFMVVEAFAKDNSLSWRYSADFMGFFIKSQEFVLLKPSTFMNKSGESVKNVLHFFKIDKKDILAIHDDLDLEFGNIRISFDSSSAGHRGVESLIESLGGFDFARLRIGIGHPSRKVFDPEDSDRRATDGEQADPEKYVLEEFTDDQKAKLPDVIKKAEESIRSYLESGIEATMNRFN